MSKSSETPIRSAVRPSSPLADRIKDGIQALSKQAKNALDPKIRNQFGDSLDIDDAFKREHAEDRRWDYLLGHQASTKIVAVELHKATNGEISTIVEKKKAAQKQLKPHLQASNVAGWIWATPTKDHFTAMERVSFQLLQNGILFAGTSVLPKHLQALGIKP